MPLENVPPKGSLESLEDNVHEKIATINALLKLRALAPKESIAHVFNGVIEDFKKIDEEIQELQKSVEQEKSVTKYITSVFSANIEQNRNLEKLFSSLGKIQNLHVKNKNVNDKNVTRDHNESHAKSVAGMPRSSNGTLVHKSGCLGIQRPNISKAKTTKFAPVARLHSVKRTHIT
ncbi:hypothetical protein BdWA1_003043 [Babesia duncani]|uniref:Uncharacterized protein n=1 Tax=Babesia duncani TaxID=323732 RepID=A0AAD9PIA5_9APIC|nr:hypothetical protein BdWA1_003043 [Babesia duncani]